MNQKGFTLIEVILALMILSGFFVAFNSSMSGTNFSLRKAEKLQVISSLLKSKLTELELKYLQAGYSAIPEEENGDFGTEFKDLSWKAEVRELEFPDLTSMLITEESQNEMMLTVVRKMTDHFSKNIKELKLTITWKATNTKSMDFSATTYLVNYAGGIPN